MGKFRGHSSGHSGAEKDKVYEEIGLKVSANSITQRDGRACADKLRCFTSECKNKWVLLVEKHNKTGSGGPPDPKEYLHELDVLGLEYLGGTNIEGVQYQEATAMSDEDEEEVTQQILAVERTLQGNESPMTDTVPGPGSMGKRRLFDGAQRIKITESKLVKYKTGHRSTSPKNYYRDSKFVLHSFHRMQCINFQNTCVYWGFINFTN